MSVQQSVVQQLQADLSARELAALLFHVRLVQTKVYLLILPGFPHTVYRSLLQAVTLVLCMLPLLRFSSLCVCTSDCKLLACKSCKILVFKLPCRHTQVVAVNSAFACLQGFKGGQFDIPHSAKLLGEGGSATIHQETLFGELRATKYPKKAGAFDCYYFLCCSASNADCLFVQHDGSHKHFTSFRPLLWLAAANAA